MCLKLIYPKSLIARNGSHYALDYPHVDSPQLGVILFFTVSTQHQFWFCLMGSRMVYSGLLEVIDKSLSRLLSNAQENGQISGTKLAKDTSFKCMQMISEFFQKHLLLRCSMIINTFSGITGQFVNLSKSSKSRCILPKSVSSALKKGLTHEAGMAALPHTLECPFCGRKKLDWLKPIIHRAEKNSLGGRNLTSLLQADHA